MPLVMIDVVAGKTSAYQKAVLDGVHEALVACFNIPEHDRMQRLREYRLVNFERLPYMSTDAVVIHILAFSGRSTAAKAALYRRIVDNLSHDPGIKPMDVFIVVQDVERENWGIRGGQMASTLQVEQPPQIE